MGSGAEIGPSVRSPRCNLARPYLIEAYRGALPHTLLARESTEVVASDLRTLGLTGRQAEVLALVAMGRSDADAAAELGISRRTAQKHLELCYRTWSVSNRSEAARIVWQTIQRGPRPSPEEG